MFDGGAQHFAVVYADGDREVNVGNVAVDPAALTFKRLVSLLSHKIGISPRNFSVYLAAVGSDRKIHLTSKVNLAAAMPLDGAAAYYFLLVKRNSSSRRSRKAAANPSPPARERKTPPENVMLLRRAAGESQIAALRAVAAAPPFFDSVEFEMRMMNLRMERERFLMNMAINDGNTGREALDACGRISGCSGGRGRRLGLVCDKCFRATTTGTDDGGFHHCVYDEVTVGFRSSAGPISRPPAKNPGETAVDGGFLLSRDKLKRRTMCVEGKKTEEQ